jgi:hypothetical protein
VRFGAKVIAAMAVASAPGTFVTVMNLDTAGAAAAPAGCVTAGLVTWLNTDGDGAAGSTFFSLEFTNLSGHACTMLGFPGVSAVNLGGGQVGSAAGRSSGSPSSLITLGPGGTATATLQITEAANFPNATCHRTTAAGIRVYPPNQRSSSAVGFPFPACAAEGPIYLHVGPVHKG